MRLENQLPDEEALNNAFMSGAFRLGEHQGRWKRERLEWPCIFIAIRAADREKGPEYYSFRFHCEGYPHVAVTARLWDGERNVPLPVAQWPTGQSRVPAVFRPDWKNGTCLYLPCDRITAEGHEAWRTEHPSLQWNPSKGIHLYLEVLHGLLNSSDYQGVRGG